jgi:indolepyruvate ferredoxin oxidoreductase alpha subunit
VLAEVAQLAGYERVIKGETHGMAQLGGPVISTFGCGEVHSPVLAPGSADVLVALERSEVLRDAFLDLLRPGGTLLLNTLAIVPPGVAPEEYPTLAELRAALAGHRVLELDALAEARAIGDLQGRTSNVIALGVLSTIEPFARIPPVTWRRALDEASPGELVKRANLAAFERGREVGARLAGSRGAAIPD